MARKKQADPQAPKAFELLTGEAKKKWDELRPKLREATPIVLDQLCVYCVAYGRWYSEQEKLEAGSAVIVQHNQQGQPVKAYPHPRVMVIAQLEKQMREASEWFLSLMQE